MKKKLFILNCILMLSLFLSFNIDITAKTYRSRRSSSFKSFKSKKTYKSSTSKYKSSSSKKKSSSSSKKGSSFFGGTSSSKKAVSSAASKKYYDSVVKKQPKKTYKSTSSKTNSKLFSSYSNKTNRKFTKQNYYNYKSNYYYSTGFTPPRYYYNSYRSFGMWDALFLWWMLDRIDDRRYSRFYYSHRYDEDMIAWREEAEKQAVENEELREKLDKLDTKVNELQSEGVELDEEYIPDDIEPELVFSEEALEDNFVSEKRGLPIGNIFAIFAMLGGVLMIFRRR